MAVLNLVCNPSKARLHLHPQPGESSDLCCGASSREPKWHTPLRSTLACSLHTPAVTHVTSSIPKGCKSADMSCVIGRVQMS